jgi:hypothetical protein
MGKLRTPSKHVMQKHMAITERNQQRLTDAVPGAAPDRSDGDLKVGSMDEMKSGECTPGRSTSWDE